MSFDIRKEIQIANRALGYEKQLVLFSPNAKQVGALLGVHNFVYVRKTYGEWPSAEEIARVGAPGYFGGRFHSFFNLKDTGEQIAVVIRYYS
jgi:hypothetical protein